MGGLGFKKFIHVSTAMLAKLGWNLVKGEDSLWTSIMKALNSYFSCKAKKGDSMVWPSILSAKEAILRGSCFSISDGWSINPRVDLWCPWSDGKVPLLLEGVNRNGI